MSEWPTARPMCKWVYLDTEYNPETMEVYWVGVTTSTSGGQEVQGMPADPAYLQVVKPLLEDPTVLKAAHNINADMRVLAKAGVNLRGPLYDTMVGMHVLHPGMEVGLDHAATFYLDDVKYWKGEDHHRPEYNGKDVAYGAAVMLAQWREADRRPVNPWGELWSRMACLPVIADMEARGMPVDTRVQRALIEHMDSELERLSVEVQRAVAPLWERRVVRAAEEAVVAGGKEGVVRAQFKGMCPKHPTYDGLRKPAKTCLTCAGIREQAVVAMVPANAGTHRKNAARARVVAKRLTKGFNPNNNGHLRWLLYDAAAYNLPLKVDKKTRKLTATKDVVEELVESAYVKRKRPDALPVLQRIKQVREMAKAKSTFLDIPLDEKGVAHPPYKLHVAVTGRWSSGEDEDEKADNGLAYNAQNIPKEWRHMYVAPEGMCLLSLDYVNQEGYLAAHYSRDKGYQAAFKEQSAGGVKVHDRTAQVIYGCAIGTAKNMKVVCKGKEMRAYDAAKNMGHAWTYSYEPVITLEKNFKLAHEEAVRIDAVLSKARPGVVAWKEALVRQVLGEWGVNAAAHNEGGKVGRWRAVCTAMGQRWLANALGWQLSFYGMASVRGASNTRRAVHDQANEVLAFLPQSTGASILCRVVPIIAERYTIYTVTHDSVCVVVPAVKGEIRRAYEWVRGVMEQPWAQLEGLVLPVEGEVGSNWGRKSGANVEGLRPVEEVL